MLRAGIEQMGGKNCFADWIQESIATDQDSAARVIPTSPGDSVW
jgi:hypothetical protein